MHCIMDCNNNILNREKITARAAEYLQLPRILPITTTLKISSVKAFINKADYFIYTHYHIGKLSRGIFFV